MSAIYDLADQYVEEVAALDPVAATRVGIAGHDSELSDYSPDGVAAIADLDQRYLKRLEDTPPEGDRDRVAREVMAERLRARLDRFEAGEHFRDLRILNSPFQAPVNVFDVQPRQTDAQWEALVERLEGVPRMLGGYLHTVREGFARGTPAVRFQVEQCIAQAETYGGDGRMSGFARLVEEYQARGDKREPLAQRLGAGAAKAAEAYRDAARALTSLLPRAEERDAVGAERYRLGARSFTGADLELDETYSWAWEEMAAIEQEMEATAERVKPGATVAEAVEALENDPARAIEGAEAWRAWLQKVHDQALDELHGRHFEIPEQIRRIEVLMPPPGGALAAHYTGPSEDFARPGRTWWPVPPGQTRFATWGDVSTAYHEGVPGHHLEVGGRRCLGAKLSRYQRLMAGISGYSEGWALYAERLMGELGYLEEPGHYLGLLSAQAMRAARVIIDIGMHLELAIPRGQGFHPGETWDRHLGLEFMVAKARREPAFLASEIVRYLGWPGQAISYKVGERYWLQARAAAKQREGSQFDLKEFHRRALDLGPMGLDQLQRKLGGA